MTPPNAQKTHCHMGLLFNYNMRRKADSLTLYRATDLYAKLAFWLWPLTTRKRRNFMDIPYVFWKYTKKSFLGHHQSDIVWPYMVMSTCPNMVKHEQGREIALFRGEGKVVVRGRMAGGRAIGVVRGQDQANRTVHSDAPRSQSKNHPNFPLRRHITQKFPLQSAVKSGIDQRRHARRLQKAHSRLPSNSCF